MDSIVKILKGNVIEAVKQLYSVEMDINEVQINETKPEFNGDYTLVTFGLSKTLRQKPADIASAIGDYLLNQYTHYSSIEIINGFLNMGFADSVWHNVLKDNTLTVENAQPKKILVEYSSPNTNKPLHFGHLRNIFLGDAVCRLLSKTGNEVIKANLINDRGIHICKSMLAWQKYAQNATPASTGIKGDHLVGDYYVQFNTILNEELKPILDSIYNNNVAPDSFTKEHQEKINNFLSKIPLTDEKDKVDEYKSEIKEIAQNYTAILQEAKQMLVDWENGDKAVLDLWHTMNSWVYNGFNTTYAKMGISFDKYYYESNTYLLGKQIVLDALNKNLVFQKENKSIWIDLTNDGLDQKLLLRGDGTSVYMTQDIGTAKLKYDDYKIDQSIYVIADEQNYHMQVLQLIMKKFGEPCAEGIYHLSYGMVELPSGRMKSREGNVVDADDMIQEMYNIAKSKTEENGKTEGFTSEELNQLYYTLGLGALKFFLLRVDPKKKMIFKPEESIDFHGFTGPFVQYTYARTCSVLRKAQPQDIAILAETILPTEKEVIKMIEQYAAIVTDAAQTYNPAVICNYLHDLARIYNKMYDELDIIKADSDEKKNLRLLICKNVNTVIKDGLSLLGINAPERM